MDEEELRLADKSDPRIVEQMQLRLWNMLNWVGKPPAYPTLKEAQEAAVGEEYRTKKR